ncbi:hypothetical protein EZI54_08450 [Marinobacter halodurans]|uniref:Uncharacterized protein n=1 Tax=Marinobacter halodurans TaxID=2528979 RepID=A0ABY1ZLK2_9GAMM|nr:hypothetical protein [Marinobacter halodurans]TBW56669.1 hypothetical protein EZI54_08450 [Marinobacter halodurans]
MHLLASFKPDLARSFTMCEIRYGNRLTVDPQGRIIRATEIKGALAKSLISKSLMGWSGLVVRRAPHPETAEGSSSTFG